MGLKLDLKNQNFGFLVNSRLSKDLESAGKLSGLNSRLLLLNSRVLLSTADCWFKQSTVGISVEKIKRFQKLRF